MHSQYKVLPDLFWLFISNIMSPLLNNFRKSTVEKAKSFTINLTIEMLSLATNVIYVTLIDVNIHDLDILCFKINNATNY